MSVHTLQLLHVEDDPMQYRLLAHHLKSLDEYDFAITCVTSEVAALEAFSQGHFDCVIVDYQLAQGDGLHLLSQLRKLDPILPIIAVSGVATSEIAVKLVQAGADDYFEKRNLSGSALCRSLKTALIRANTIRHRAERLI